MTTINMRQLRDTRRLKALLRAGKTLKLSDRDTVIARIVPENRASGPVEWPDFEARQREIFGDRVLAAADDFLQFRHRDWES